jgi:hypothetical protein
MEAEEARRRFGVYATPPIVVRYVVRSVHVLLQTRLGKPLGIADPGIRLLDPAAGSANFIRAAWKEAIACCRQQGYDVRYLIATHLLRHFLSIEIREAAHFRAHACLRRFLATSGLPPGWRHRSVHLLPPAVALATYLGSAKGHEG